MNSIQQIFHQSMFEGVTRLAVFRCKKEHDAYSRNIDWLPAGETGWWKIGHNQKFDGIVIILDSDDKKFVEVWAGPSLALNSGKQALANDEGRWILRVDGPFQFMGAIKASTVKSFLAKQPGNGVTYIDLDSSYVPIEANQPKDRSPEVSRGFNPEFAGDRAPVQPGTYTPNSDHGKIIIAFYAWLKSNHYQNIDNQAGWWDLHGFAPDGLPHLFELKTSSATTSVYTAIGQLLMYELEAGTSQKIMVLPELTRTTEVWKEKLESLDIGLITYAKTSDSFKFTARSGFIGLMPLT